MSIVGLSEVIDVTAELSELEVHKVSVVAFTGTLNRLVVLQNGSIGLWKQVIREAAKTDSVMAPEPHPRPLPVELESNANGPFIEQHAVRYGGSGAPGKAESAELFVTLKK